VIVVIDAVVGEGDAGRASERRYRLSSRTEARLPRQQGGTLVSVQPDSSATSSYRARLEIDYPERLDRVTTAFRLIWIIPIGAVLSALTAAANETVTRVSGDVVTTTTRSGGGISGGLFAATALMILFRRRYPRWWFDFARELVRFQARVAAYFFLLTDRYPSTVDEQSVHLEIDYPDVERDLNRWLPLVKWLLAIPHYVVLAVLAVAGIIVWVIAWFATLFTGRYPRALFDFLVGVGRWGLRVQAYVLLLVTDQYPPFSLR
jgi:Domain of unknown function (DUF4389)